MIFWSGWGWLVPVVAFFAALGTELAVEAITGQDRYYQEHGWPVILALAAAGGLLALAALALARRPARIVVDEQTGERLALGAKHTFFFVPLAIWAAVLPVIGLAIALAR
jgi:hypothetical protein